MSRFTAEQAIELEGSEDAIILSEADARRVCAQHDAEFDDWLSEGGEIEGIDAGRLFNWLGY
ncbi:hypothetical protein [Rhizobium leguminosarum]|uniref:hypothetical protein n=1 Tax=Rhizobium leguminosarum TaxID=384 RepID=UPI0004808EE8|nr:hypothetical protein [Rhizobium leguminosarum]